MSAQLDVRPGYHPGSIPGGGLAGDHGHTCRAGAGGARQPEEQLHLSGRGPLRTGTLPPAVGATMPLRVRAVCEAMDLEIAPSNISTTSV